MVTTSLIQKSLVTALTNDKAGAVSLSDAKAISEAGIKEIFKSKDPAATFARTQKFIDAAGPLASSGSVSAMLNKYKARGQGAVEARLEQITGNKQLPASIAKRFKELMVDTSVAGSASDVKISGVKQSSAGYEFKYEIGGETKSAFAISYAGGHVLSPVKLTKTALDAASEAMRDILAEDFQEMLEEHTAAEVKAMKKLVVPDHAFFPGQDSDPYSYTDEYPVVLSLHNPTGSDHGFYVGIDPAKPAEASAYAFN